jgi:predicted Zn finger-like uncharacterized protein
MAIEALCPTCGAVFNLKDEYEGKKVRCKKCEQIFTVGGEKAAARDDRGVKSKADAAPAKKSARDDDEDDERSSRKGRVAAKRGRDDDDDDRPKKKASRRDRDDDDDDDKPGKRKRTYHDDDDDDDDRPSRRAPKRSSGGGTGKVLAIVGGAVALIVLICGGGIYGIVRLANNIDEAAEAQQQDWQNAANNGGNPWGGGFPGFERQPKDMGEALTFLKGNDPNDRRGAANWLANQPLDAGKQKEVATALEVLVKDPDDNNCAAGCRAMKVWGTKDNGPALATALKSRPDGGIPGDAHKELMAAIARVKYEAGADEILRFLPNFFIGGEAERALFDLGQGAEKYVLKYYHHPDGGTRGKARGLCVRYGTKPLVILDQTATDLASIDKGRSGAALEWLSKQESTPALEATKADPARRTAIAVALNHVIDDPPSPFVGGQVLDAARRWGTKDNAAALVRLLEREPFNKKGVGDALIAIGPGCEPAVKPLLNHSDGGVASEAKRILNAVGSPESKFEAILTDLKSDNGGRIRDSARTLQTTPVNEQQRAQVVAALLDTMANTGPGRTDGDCALDVARAVVIWATKDDAGTLAEKLRNTNKFFTKQSRPVLFEWMGKQKAEKAIPFLAGCLANGDDYQSAGKALIAMGPDLGEKIEDAVSAVQTADPNQLTECFKVLGAVGTKKSLNLLKTQQALVLKQNKLQLAAACQDAADATTPRGK